MNEEIISSENVTIADLLEMDSDDAIQWLLDNQDDYEIVWCG